MLKLQPAQSCLVIIKLDIGKLHYSPTNETCKVWKKWQKWDKRLDCDCLSSLREHLVLKRCSSSVQNIKNATTFY